MSDQEEGIVLGPGEGEIVSVRDTQFVFKVSDEDSGKTYELFEYTEPPGGQGPPPHIHYTHDEAFYILEGEIVFRMGKRSAHVGPGSFVLVPKGVPHSFSNPSSSQPATFLGIISPGGLKSMFKERAEVTASMGGTLSAEIWAEIGRKHDQHPADPLT